ncbi:MAG: T9SS type A sorting domain-containing protein, partial [Ferruginibacter sp.]|nr:T9SS type A sorting domain-containing protein [Ferruginibacter sp.]
LTTGIDVVRSNDPKTTHTNNIYKLSGGSVANTTLGSTELSTAAAIFNNTTAADPISWNYTPVAGSPLVDFGVNVGIARDFVGNTVPSVPNAGILETSTGNSALTATSTPGTINCFGGSTTITVTATGGSSPYTGTGIFTVSAGTFAYTVADAVGAVVTTTVTVLQPTLLNASVIAGTAPTASGTANATVISSGGTTAYSYSLDAGAYQTSNVFQGVAVGSHSVKIKDAKACTVIRTFNISAAASSFSATAVAALINCNGAATTVTVTATGGTPPYTGTGTFTVNAGNYTYTVTDATGSITSTTVGIIQPTALTAVVVPGMATSASGTAAATVTASGGTPTFTYSLDGGSYQSSNIFTAIPVGNHIITVRDGRGCSVNKSFTISADGSSPLIITAVTGTISCNGGTATVTISATGGQPSYTGTGTFTVSAGTYVYTVTDAAGTTGTYTVSVSQPASIAITATATPITVAGGVSVVTIATTGGISPYTFKIGSGSYQSVNIFTGMGPGAYAVTVKDARGCTATSNVTVTATQQPNLQIYLISKTNNSCKWTWDGTITVGATGGTAPYNYRINNYGYGTRNTFINLGPGTYTLYVKDARNIVSSMNVTILKSDNACSGRASTVGKGTEMEEGVPGTPITEWSLQAYPNPTSSEFSLIVKTDNLTEKARFVVINMNGQKVHEGTTTANRKVTFGNNFISGIYILKVIQGGKTKTLKLVKAK